MRLHVFQLGRIDHRCLAVIYRICAVPGAKLAMQHAAETMYVNGKMHANNGNNWPYPPKCNGNNVGTVRCAALCRGAPSKMVISEFSIQ